MVEIPPDGYKRMKNSRKMQMVFFVHEGKVTVDIEDVQFGMTKGGVWQVPRGEFLLSFSFLLHPFGCITRLLMFHIHEETAVRGLPHRNMHQQAGRQVLHAHSTHTDHVEVTPGTTYPRNTDRRQNRVFLWHGSGVNRRPCHVKEIWGTAIMRTMVLGQHDP